MASAAHKWELRIGKISSTKAGVFHESLCRFHTPLVACMIHEELESIKQSVLLSPLKKQPKTSTKTTPCLMKSNSHLCYWFLWTHQKRTKKKVVPHVKSSQRDTRLYIDKSNGQSQHFCIINSNLINQEQKEQRTIKTQQQSSIKKKGQNNIIKSLTLEPTRINLITRSPSRTEASWLLCIA